MVRSMTGFGKSARDLNGDTVSVELSSVNHRFLDANLRLPFEWAALDAPLREIIRKHLDRGKLYITVTRKRANGESTELELDRDAAKDYVEAAKELAVILGRDDELSLDALMQCEGVMVPRDQEDEMETVRKVLSEALDEALTQLDSMRRTEGDNLAKDLAERIKLIAQSVVTIEARLPEINKLYEERLRARLADLTSDTDVTEDRIALEVTLMADKGDVTEELVRLRTHLDHATELLASGEPIGRKLNFLVQEIQREINTLGSKVRDTDVVREVLEMKSELERIREQIQNIE